MPPRLPLPLPLLLLLAAAAARLGSAQPATPSPRASHFYCDTPGREFINRAADFYVHTRPNGSDRYQPGSRCAFYALSQSPGAVYFVQFINVSLPTATLNITSDPHLLLSLSRGTAAPPGYATALTTPGATVTVSFAADASEGVAAVGAVLRVRLFAACPPDWVALGGFCFGNAGADADPAGRQLNFANAQAACGMMRANLLHVPPNLPQGVATVTDLFRRLPSGLTTDNWIGLTDYTSDGQFYYYWLDGTRLYDSNVIGCQSSKLGNNRNCKIDERCGFFITSVLYLFRFIVMDKCASERSYTCFMPAGGASVYYSVPSYSIFSPGAWAWAIVIGCLFAIGVAIGAVYAVLRLCSSRRSGTVV